MSTKADYRLRHVPIGDIKTAPYNPGRRIKDGKMKQLQRSIESVGLIYPLAVNDTNELIDGHRRLFACKKLGWDSVPVVVVSGDRDSIYAEVNATSCRMSGNDNLNVFLSNPAALPQNVRRYLEKAESIIGRELLAKMAKAGASVVYYRWAKEIAGYVERADDGGFVQRCIRWMLRHKASKAVIFAIKSAAPPRTIERAILKDRPLTQKYAIG